MVYLGGFLAEVNPDHLILVGRDEMFTIRLTKKQVENKMASRYAALEGKEIIIPIWFEPNFSKCWLGDAKPREFGHFIQI